MKLKQEQTDWLLGILVALLLATIVSLSHAPSESVDRYESDWNNHELCNEDSELRDEG